VNTRKRDGSQVPEPGVRLGIVTAQDVVRYGLTAMLAEHPGRVRIVEVDPSAPTPGEVDVYLYDVLGLNERDGLDLEGLIKVGNVVALTRVLRPDLAARAVAHGAVDRVSMSANSRELLEAVVDAATRPTDPGARDASRAPDEVWRGQSSGLTAQEDRVLALITAGLSNKEIADALYLSINSVKSHIRNAYQKIGVSRRSQAVSWCIEHGYDPAVCGVHPLG
jgi:DNA-binding NarL/FixJ family response regulator